MEKKYCQRCEKEITSAEVLLSLPPHNPDGLKKICLSCALEEVAKYNLEHGRPNTKKILVIKPKKKEEGTKDEDV